MSDQNAISLIRETLPIAHRLSVFVENEMALGASNSGFPIFAAMGLVAAHFADQTQRPDADPAQSQDIMLRAFAEGYGLFKLHLKPEESPDGAVKG